MRRIERLDDQTLNVLVASGPWETIRSGGDEVDIDLYFPPSDRPSKNAPNSRGDCEHLAECLRLAGMPE